MSTINVTVIVSGVPHTAEYQADAPLSHVINRALHESGNLGQPPDGWEMRNSEGALLDTTKTVEEATRLWLSPHAGAGASGRDDAGAVTENDARVAWNSEAGRIEMPLSWYAMDREGKDAVMRMFSRVLVAARSADALGRDDG